MIFLKIKVHQNWLKNAIELKKRFFNGNAFGNGQQKNIWWVDNKTKIKFRFFLVNSLEYRKIYATLF